MMAENILDDTHPENTQFANCKIKYLLAQNKLMTTQLGSVTNLIQKYKKIIDVLSKQQNKNQEIKDLEENKIQKKQASLQVQQINPQIGKVLKEAQDIIEKCILDCKQISSNKNIFQDEESTITPAFFAELVLSYQKTISQLKQSIHQRQILLQQLQTRPNHPMKRPQQSTESSAIIKAIESYDVYPKISQKCRKQILDLKQKKKMMQLASTSSTNSHMNSKISELSRKQNTNNTIEIDKTVRKVSQYCSNNSQINFQEKTQIQVESMSPFQKAILIYKKKKIFNDILQARVIDLKKKIKEKQHCNQILKRRIQNQVWENIENINHFGKNLDQDDPAYLSMLNQSIRANNLDFSVDISRVVNCGNLKIENPPNLQNILAEVDNQNQYLKDKDIQKE